MAVLQMQRISLCALQKDRKQILELLQRRGVIEINDIMQQDSVFQKTDMSSAQSVFEKSSNAAIQALEILEKYDAEKKSMFAALEGKEKISIAEYYELGCSCDNIMEKVYHIINLSKEIAENKANIIKLKTQIEMLIPWMTLDIPMNFKGTKTTAVFIGSFPSVMAIEEIYAEIARQNAEIEAFNVDIISASKDQTCIIVLCKNKQAAIMEDALRSISFTYPSSPSFVPPAESTKELESQICSFEGNITDAENEIKEYAHVKNKIKFVIDYYKLRAEKYDVIGHLLQSRRTFILTGYVPEWIISNLDEELNQKFDLAVEYENPSEDEDVPVLLKNNGFSRPVEGVLESYGLPNRSEVDPTSIMSYFYYFLFGLMLSDAAYGFLMAALSGILLLKYRDMKPGTKNFLSMFFFCGIFTMFWGVMFSSYFGDAVDVISKTFFGTQISIPPVWFTPINDPMRMLVFAMAVGVVHLFVGLGLQLYQLIRAKRFKDALYDVIFWYMLLIGLILMLLPSDMFTSIAQIKITLPAVLTKLVPYLAGIGAIGIILTAGRESKNWVKRLLKGAYGLYNVTGYLSDVLSYSRLLALGLATGVIASVINQMGSMGGRSVFGVLLFVVVFIFGHLFNIAINLLGAYVHTNRLQFVEFFSKFYEGGGRKFEPFAAKSEYYQIKEEEIL